MCEDARGQAADVGNGAATILVFDKLREELASRAGLILTQHVTFEVVLQMLLPDLDVPIHGGWFVVGFDEGLVHTDPKGCDWNVSLAVR